MGISQKITTRLAGLGSNSGPPNASPEGYHGIWANVHLVYLFTSPLCVARKGSDPTSRDWEQQKEDVNRGLSQAVRKLADDGKDVS